LVQILQVTWHCLMYCNSCVNPFIYNYTSKDFRDGFREVVARWRTTSSAAAGSQQTSAPAAIPAPGDAVATGGQPVIMRYNNQ